MENPLVLKLNYRLNKKNKDLLAITVGEKGSGKSWGSIRLAELIDPDFDPSKIFFSADELRDRLEAEKGEKGYLTPGSVTVLDEAGISDTARARNWWSETNKVLDEIFQVVRHRNLGFFLTVPFKRLIDRNIRDNCHMQFVSKEEDGDHFLEPSWMKYNYYKDSTYYAYPRYSGNRIVKLKMNPPSQEIIDWYEESADEYKRKVARGEASSSVNNKKKKVKKKVMENPEKFSVEMSANPGRSLRNALLREHLDVKKSRVSEIRAFLDNDEEVQEALGRPPDLYNSN